MLEKWTPESCQASFSRLKAVARVCLDPAEDLTMLTSPI